MEGQDTAAIPHLLEPSARVELASFVYETIALPAEL